MIHVIGEDYGRHRPDGLSVACLPGLALAGMLTYSTLVALYLGYVGLAGGFTGLLLWSAVLLHVVLSVLLARLVVQNARR